MTAITQTSPAKHNSVRYRYHHDDDVIYTGEATVEYRTFNEEYEGGGYHTVNIETCWEIGTGAPKEIHPADIPMDIESAIMEECVQNFTYPSEIQIELPSDWDGFEVIETEYVYLMNVDKSLPFVWDNHEKYGLKYIRKIEHLPRRPDVKWPVKIYSTGCISDTIKEMASIAT